MSGRRGSGTGGRCKGPGEAAGLLFALAVGVFAAAPARAQAPAYADLTQSAAAAGQSQYAATRPVSA